MHLKNTFRTEIASCTRTSVLRFFVVMQMWFYTSTSVTLWFKKWTMTETWPYIGTLIGLFALCLVQEALTTFRNSCHSQHVKLTTARPQPSTGDCGCGGSNDAESGRAGLRGALAKQPPKWGSMLVPQVFNKCLKILSLFHVLRLCLCYGFQNETAWRARKKECWPN